MKVSRFGVFVLVGVIGFLVDAGVLYLGSHTLGLEVHLARVASFLAASAVTWRLNRRYTFEDRVQGGRQIIEWLRYLWSSALGGLVNYGAFSIVVALAGIRGFYPLIGVAVGSLAGMCVNYLLYSLYVFRRRT